MAEQTPARVIRDEIMLPANGFVIDNLQPGQYMSAAKRRIGIIDGLMWTVRVYCNCDDMRVCLWLSRPALASGTISWGFQNNGSKNFEFMKLPSGETTIVESVYSEDIGERGFVKCAIKFKTDNSDSGRTSCIKLPNNSEPINDPDNCTSDAKIVVGDQHLTVHRSVLSTMSPVFQSYFEHDSGEAATGIIEVPDFDFNTVKNVVDYACGRIIGEKTVPEVIDMLRFAEKYDIKTVLLKLETILSNELKYETFSTVAQYAWKFERKDLQIHCAKYYRKNLQYVTFTPGFLQLTAEVQNAIITAAASQLA